MKTLLKKICLLGVALILTLSVAEIFLRLSPPGRGTNPAADRGPLFYNQAPDRGHPSSRDATNVLRIAVIGDSFTQGSGVQVDDRYGARLERMLNLNDGVPPVEVRIFSHSGTSTFQQKYLLQEALAWNPAVVVLGICLNDTEDWTHPARIDRWREEWMPRSPGPFRAFCQRHSRVAALIDSRLWAFGSARRCVRYYRHLYEPDGSGLLRMRNAIGFFKEECASRNIVFVPVIWPLLSFDFSPERYPMQFAHDAIHQICRDHGIPYLDLLPSFLGTIPKRMELVPGVDPHPSEIAHRIAAEAIVAYLVRQNCIAAGYKFVERKDNMAKRLIWDKTIQHLQGRPGELVDEGSSPNADEMDRPDSPAEDL